MNNSNTNSGTHSTIISENIMGLIFTLLAAVYLMLTFGATLGRTIVFVSALPMFLVFRWTSEPLVHMLTGEKQEENDVPVDDLTDLKDEHRVATIKKNMHEDIHAHIEGEYWICACGTRNRLDRNATIQNCSHCFRSRDFVLGNYSSELASLQEKSNKLEDALKKLAAA